MLIVITTPDYFETESTQISLLLEAGLKILHLRKPESSVKDYERLLQSIPFEFHNRIVLHEHFELTEKYEVRGIHLNRRFPTYSGNKNICISKSCHSFNELKEINHFEYVFLSPIFNSISKKGYNAAFGSRELKEASRNRLINKKVMALGGINKETIPLLKPYNFGGAAILGDIWLPVSKFANQNYSIKKEFETILSMDKITFTNESRPLY